MVKVYSAGIRIHASMGKVWSDAVPIAESEYAQLFIDFTTAQLDKLKALPTGAFLLQEIAGSGNQLTIFASKKAGSTTSAETEDASTVINRFPKSFRPPIHSVPEATANSRAEAQQLQQQWLASHPGQLKPWQLSQPLQYYSRELKIVIDRSPYTKETLAPLVGKTSAELQQMIDGTLPIEDVVNQKLQLRLYEWLTPGPGINTCVAFDAAAKTFCEESAKRDWEAGDVPFIILGHELIHAWRMLTGRRIFLGGVGEEHMTTGLPPYSAMKFTENKLRAEANLAIRDYYSANPLLQELEMVTSVSSPYLRRQQGLAKFWTAATGKR